MLERGEEGGGEEEREIVAEIREERKGEYEHEESHQVEEGASCWIWSLDQRR